MKRLFISFLVSAFFGTICSQEINIASIEVHAGKYDRLNSPVSACMDILSANNDSVRYVLTETTGGKTREIPVQVNSGHNTTISWILDGKTEKGSTRHFLLYMRKKECESSPLNYILTDRYLRITQGKKNVLQYNHAVHYPPEGVDTIYKRSAFIHPLWTPSGNILTRINPPDHYHHLGIWNPWTSVSYGNREIDFWNLNKGQGTVSFRGYLSVISGPVITGFSALHDHLIINDDGSNTGIMNEVWHIYVWNVSPEESKNCYLVDFVSLLSCSTDKEVSLESYRYGGGLGFRATEYWTNNNSYVLTSEGKTRQNADASRARWADAGARYPDSTKQGIIFFSHPANRDHPEPMRVWPENSNGGRGDMFFEFCPVRHNAWVLKPGKTYSQKYRMLIYDKKIDSLTVENIWNDFANPPELITTINKKSGKHE